MKTKYLSVKNLNLFVVNQSKYQLQCLFFYYSFEVVSNQTWIEQCHVMVMWLSQDKRLMIPDYPLYNQVWSGTFMTCCTYKMQDIIQRYKIGNERCSLEFQKHYKILKFPNLQILDLYSSFRLNFSSPSNLVKYETWSKLFEIS